MRPWTARQHGDFLLSVPLTLHLQRTTDSGIAVAALMICLFAPMVLLAPLSGWLVDRYNGLRNGAELLAIGGGGVLAAAIGARTPLALAGALTVLAALIGLAIYLRWSPAPRIDPGAAPSG